MDMYNLSFPRDFGIGFDDVFTRMHRLMSSEENNNNVTKFPPYNIINESDTESIVEMAVAGFSSDELDITVENNVLKIVGKRDVKLDDAKYQHKGIAYRNFERNFALSDYIEVNGASCAEGILRVYLEKVVPEDMKPRKINIVNDRQLLVEDQKHQNVPYDNQGSIDVPYDPSK